MTDTELYEKLKKTGLPVAYREFKRRIAPPYIVYFTEDEETYGADDTPNLIESKNFVIELYSTKKDTETENEIKKILKYEPYYYTSHMEDDFHVSVFGFRKISKIKTED